MGIKGYIRFQHIISKMRIFKTNLYLMGQCNKIICEREKEPTCLYNVSSYWKVVGEMVGK